jgi:hypothetical protein
MRNLDPDTIHLQKIRMEMIFSYIMPEVWNVLREDADIRKMTLCMTHAGMQE